MKELKICQFHLELLFHLKNNLKDTAKYKLFCKAKRSKSAYTYVDFFKQLKAAKREGKKCFSIILTKPILLKYISKNYE
jgi:hypothetical protein